MLKYYLIDKHRGSIIVNGEYNKDSEAFQVTRRIFDTFYNTVIENNVLPIIFMFPHRDDVHHYRKNRTKRYAPLLSYFDSQRYFYIDLMDAFEQGGERYDMSDLFVRHYSAFANELIARYILRYLEEHGLLNMNHVTAQINTLKQNR